MSDPAGAFADLSITGTAVCADGAEEHKEEHKEEHGEEHGEEHERDPFQGLRPTPFSPVPGSARDGDPREAVRKLREYLNTFLRVSIQDGRCFIGRFKCIDRDRNIVLDHADEVTVKQTKVGGAVEVMDELKRHLNLVMVPGMHITKIETSDTEGYVDPSISASTSTDQTAETAQ